MNKTQLVFAVLAILVIASMVLAALAPLLGR